MSDPPRNEAFLTLVVRSDTVYPEDIAAAIQLEPTRLGRIGEPHPSRLRPYRTYEWYYRTPVFGYDSYDASARVFFDIVSASEASLTPMLDELRISLCVVVSCGHWDISAWLEPEYVALMGRLRAAVEFNAYHREPPDPNAEIPAESGGP